MAVNKYVSQNNLQFFTLSLIMELDKRYRKNSGGSGIVPPEEITYIYEYMEQEFSKIYAKINHTHNATEIITDDTHMFVTKADIERWNNCQGGSGGLVEVNGSYTEVIPASKWVASGDKFITTVKHNMKSKNIMSSLRDTVEGDLLVIGTDIIDENTVELTSNIAIESEVFLISSNAITIDSETLNKISYFSTTVNNWVQNENSTGYTATVKHNLGTTHLVPAAIDENGDNIFLTYKVVDKNTMEIYSESNYIIDLTLLCGDASGNKEIIKIGDSVDVNDIDWVEEPDGSGYTITINHGRNSENIVAVAYDNVEKESMTVSVKLIDLNTIKLFSINKFNGKVIVLSSDVNVTITSDGSGNSSNPEGPIVLTGSTNVVEFNDTRSSVEIGIKGYNKSLDFLEVHYNGLLLAEGLHYSISEDSLSITNISGSWNSPAYPGQQMIFRVISGGAINGKLKEIKTTLDVPGNCTELPIGVSYKPGADVLSVHLNGVLLVENLDFYYSEGKIYKSNVLEPWNPHSVNGQKMFIRILRNNYVSPGGSGGGSNQAVDILIEDASGLFVADNVEDALKETKKELNVTKAELASVKAELEGVRSLLVNTDNSIRNKL